MSLTMIAMCWNQRSLLHQILGPVYAEGVLHGPRRETRRGRSAIPRARRSRTGRRQPRSSCRAPQRLRPPSAPGPDEQIVAGGGALGDVPQNGLGEFVVARGRRENDASRMPESFWDDFDRHQRLAVEPSVDGAPEVGAHEVGPVAPPVGADPPGEGYCDQGDEQDRRQNDCQHGDCLHPCDDRLASRDSLNRRRRRLTLKSVAEAHEWIISTSWTRASFRRAPL